MKRLKDLELEAAAYVFERANGNTHSDYENGVILDSGVSNFAPNDLEVLIVDGLNKGVYKAPEERISAYWALSKRGKSRLIPMFRKWLTYELKAQNDTPIFQLMIALSNLEEPVFKKGKMSFDYREVVENLRDAKVYLESLKG